VILLHMPRDAAASTWRGVGVGLVPAAKSGETTSQEGL